MDSINSLANVVAVAAKMRGDPLVMMDFIRDALERIRDGKEVVEEYPATGNPSLRDVYKIAARLQQEAATAEAV